MPGVRARQRPLSAGDIQLLKAWAESKALSEQAVQLQPDGSALVGPLSAGDQIYFQQHNADMYAQYGVLGLTLEKYQPPKENSGRVRITTAAAA